MKRDTSCHVSIATEHPLMLEDANLEATYRPGKKGETFGLPLGAKLILSDGPCGKKDYVTCQVASPSQRWRHFPSFPGEQLTSEIFTLSGNMLKQRNTQPTARTRKTAEKKEVKRGRESVLVLPYYPPTGRYVQLRARVKWEGESEWQKIPFVNQTDNAQPCVEVQVEKMGTFLLTSLPQTDPLPPLTPEGGLFNSRINRIISLRFPKKAVDSTVHYEIQITEVPAERLTFCKENFPTACRDLEHVTELIHLHPSPPNTDFRRPATIKLPLPADVTWDEESTNQIAVLHKGDNPEGSSDGWQWLDCEYRFTRSSVTFHLMNPMLLCVVRCTADRQRKMAEAVMHLERHLHHVPGDVTSSLSLRSKEWQLVLDCYPHSLAPTRLATRLEQGFTPLDRLETRQEQELTPLDTKIRKGSTVDKGPKEINKYPGGLPLHEGLMWTIEVTGDISGTPRSEMSPQAGLQWFRQLPDSYRLLWLEPAVTEIRELIGTVRLTPQGIEGDPELRDALTVEFSVTIPEEMVQEFRPPPPSPPSPAPVAAVKDVKESKVKRPSPVSKVPTFRKKVYTFSQTPMERLTQPPRRISAAAKETKVLSGKSLAVLAKMVDSAVSLAVQLGLNESTVYGLGFDELSTPNNSSTSLTYRMLVLWKRSCKKKQDEAVQELTTALRRLGKSTVADVILERHRHNLELTLESFLGEATLV